MKPIYIISLIAILAITTSGILFFKLQQKNLDHTPKIINQVGKLMLLPIDETPTVATIADKNKLADQPFFTQAENGDSILIYLKAQRAILYRPSINKIIDISPITKWHLKQYSFLLSSSFKTLYS